MAHKVFSIRIRFMNNSRFWFRFLFSCPVTKNKEKKKPSNSNEFEFHVNPVVQLHKTVNKKETRWHVVLDQTINEEEWNQELNSNADRGFGIFKETDTENNSFFFSLDFFWKREQNLTLNNIKNRSMFNENRSNKQAEILVFYLNFASKTWRRFMWCNVIQIFIYFFFWISWNPYGSRDNGAFLFLIYYFNENDFNVFTTFIFAWNRSEMWYIKPRLIRWIDISTPLFFVFYFRLEY